MYLHTIFVKDIFSHSPMIKGNKCTVIVTNVFCSVGVWQTYIFNSDSPYSAVLQPTTQSPLRIRDLVGRDTWYDKRFIVLL